MQPATPEGRQSAGKPSGTNKETRPGGNGHGVRVEGIKFTKKDNWLDFLLVLAYDIGSRGQATVSEVLHDVEIKFNCTFHGNRGLNMVSDGLEALRKQDLLAEAQNADGQGVFSLKRIKFNCNPALVSMKAMIEELKSDSAGMLIIERFTAGEGAKQVKERPEEPADFLIEYLLLWPILGSQVWAGNLYLQEMYFALGKLLTLHETNPDGTIKLDKNGNRVMKEEFSDHTDVPLMFERGTDCIVAAHTATISGFLEKAFEAFPPSTYAKRGYQAREFIGSAPIVINPPSITIEKKPVIRNEKGVGQGGQACGLRNYEVIKPGVQLTLEIACCTKNFITPPEMYKWLKRVLRMPIRSMSPARGKQTGGAKLLSLKYRPWSSDSDDYQEVPDPRNGASK